MALPSVLSDRSKSTQQLTMRPYSGLRRDISPDVVARLTPLIKRRDVIGLVLLTAVLVAIGLARLPLQAVLLVAIPISLAVTFYMRRRISA